MSLTRKKILFAIHKIYHMNNVINKIKYQNYIMSLQIIQKELNDYKNELNLIDKK